MTDASPLSATYPPARLPHRTWAAQRSRTVLHLPGALKKEAVRHTLFDPITPMCPATALRLHPRCTLYLDPDSASAVNLSNLPGGDQGNAHALDHFQGKVRFL